jgi:hypothetical protein
MIITDSHLPRETLRTIAVLLVVAFDFALQKGREAVERIGPLVTPPDDLRIVSSNGSLYSGVIFLDRGEVLAGVVVATGYDPLRSAAARTASSAFSMPHHDSPSIHRAASGTLPNWADDSTDYGEDPRSPWRR